MSKPKRGKTGPSQRQLRVGELVRHALSEVLAREMPSDPELAGKSVAITEVMMTPDLKIATCFVSLLGAQGDSPAVQAVIKRLAVHEKYLRGRATPMLAQMKSMPGFRFREDTSFDNFSRIDALLRSAEVSRDLKD